MQLNQYVLKFKILVSLFDFKLLFTCNVTSVKNKMFGLIKRNCLKFNDLTTFKCFYTFLVRFQLEYASIIWETIAISHTKQIESA